MGLAMSGPAQPQPAADTLTAVIEALVGAMGLGGFGAPGVQGANHDTKATRVGELLGAVLPMGGAKRALDMSHAARMKRATEQGYGINAFHGTARDVRAFDNDALGAATGHPTASLGHYFSTDPKDAASWAGKGLNPTGRNVMPVKLKVANPYRMSADEWQAIQSSGDAAAAAARMKALGHDGIAIGNGSGGDWVVAFEPSQIRSRFAAFDPARSNSSDLLAGLGALMTSGAAAPSLFEDGR
jgi:hypothetical protein